MDPEWPITAAHGYDASGCIAATRYARITPSGNVTPCPFMENSVDSVREKPFSEIWKDTPVPNELRAPKLEGRCGACEYQNLCGGYRARPLARNGNMMGEDYLCTYQPKGGAIVSPILTTSTTMNWDAEAEEHIARVPGFVRRMVRRRA